MMRLALSLGVFLTLLLLPYLLKRLRRRTYPEGWVTAEEAAERRERAREKWADVEASQGGTLTEEQGAKAFSEIMEAGEMGFVDFQGIKLTITMPLAIRPIDRCVQFEEPLSRALGDQGVIRGGGSLMTEGDAGMEIQEVDIGVTVKDLDRGLPIIREVLKKQGAPKGTRIRQREPVEREFPLDG